MSVLRRSVQVLTSILINTFAWLLILVLYGPLLLILIGWRYFVIFLARRLRPDDLIPCSPNDTLLVQDTPDKQPILTGGFVLKVKGRIDPGKLSTLFEELFLNQDYYLENYQNLYCDLTKFCGYLFKRKIVSKVKLVENHLQIRELKENEDFNQVVASWFQQKFQKGLPLWQMLILNPGQADTGVGNDKEKDDSYSSYSYFAFKAHHVLMDGYSFVHVLDKLTGVTSPGEWAGTSVNNNDEDCTASSTKEENNNKKSFWTELKILFSVPEVVASFTFPNISWNPSSSTGFPESKPLSKFEMLPMSVGTCSLESIKDIRRKLGVHFPSIVYGLQAGALRAALLDNRSSKPFDNDESILPESILISTSLPVVGVEHPRNKFTNHWSGGYIKVPLRTSSPKERILGADQSLQSILKDEGTYITWKYLAFLIWLIPCWVHGLLEKCPFLKLCKFRSSMSCIPQSCKVQYNLMGLPVQNIYHAPIMKDAFLTAGKGNFI